MKTARERLGEIGLFSRVDVLRYIERESALLGNGFLMAAQPNLKTAILAAHQIAVLCRLADEAYPADNERKTS